MPQENPKASGPRHHDNPTSIKLKLTQMKKPYITPLALLLAGTLSAQTLTKEIVIERDVETSLPAAQRIGNFPSMLRPQVPDSRLRMVDFTSGATVPGMLTMLEPADGQPPFTLSPYRGYASLGYFPAYNLGVSAGYSIISRPTSSLNVWTQFDGNSYKDQYDESLNRNSITLGTDFSHLFGKSRRLDVSADFTYNAYNRPWEATDPDHHTLGFDIDAAWSARSHSLAYYVTAGFNHFGLSGKDVGLSYEPLDAISQNIVKASVGVVYPLSDKSSLCGHVGADFAHAGNMNTLVSEIYTGGPHVNTPQLLPGDGTTMGLITVAPSYRYTSGAFSTRLGLKAQVATKAGKTFHIAPDVQFNLRPASTFAATLSFGGGEHINRLSDLYDINPYMSVAQGVKFSEVPFTADLRLTFGPFYGASVELSGGYAMANDWLMPDAADVITRDGVVAYDDPEHTVYASMFSTVDLRAFHYGAKFTWKYSSKIEASVKYCGAPGSYSHSYYLNRDRARHLLEIKASVKPLDALTVDAGFNLRAGRSLYSHWGVMPGEKPVRYNLRNSNSLNIGATYRIFEWLSAYARVENILGRRAYMFNFLEQQGVHGLVGAAVKF